ncbi:hypothetical protein [Argonema galeatum]|uniref:hypothetical protein n=1 Tax=Argonema galeatum TaxID=2942762 RepID=UPI002011137B|nr:hypothetical protein [Argonema galeatum]MCL1463548.1 hypothetical protein [Argonema galeatum A003/A1]
MKPRLRHCYVGTTYQELCLIQKRAKIGCLIGLFLFWVLFVGFSVNSDLNPLQILIFCLFLLSPCVGVFIFEIQRWDCLEINEVGIRYQGVWKPLKVFTWREVLSIELGWEPNRIWLPSEIREICIWLYSSESAKQERIIFTSRHHNHRQGVKLLLEKMKQYDIRVKPNPDLLVWQQWAEVT